MAADEFKAKKGLPCPKCGNRLRVRPDQTGEQVRCPKCNATFTVGQAAPKKGPVGDEQYEPVRPLKKATIVPEEHEMLEACAPQPIVPMQAPPASHLEYYEVDWETSDALEAEAPHVPPPSQSVEPEYLEIARSRGLIREDADVSIPRWTFFSGVYLFPWQLGNIARWAVMAVALTLTGIVLLMTAEQMAGGVRSGTLALPMLSMFSAALSLVTLMFSSACFIAAVDDTADGHDDVQEFTMPPMDQWLFSFFSIVHIWLMSGALGYPLVFVPQIGPLAIPISSLLLFPILFLSAMECDSFFLPWSPTVWRSTLQYFGSWLAFYIISTALLAGWFVAALFLVGAATYLGMVLVAPALAAVMLIYARLLGRLAWRISYRETERQPRRRKAVGTSPDAPPRRESSREETPRPSAQIPETPPKKRRKVKKLKLPDNLDELVDRRDSDAPPKPRLDFHKK
jgi:predicted Zn finger-like uncharacterized protein